MSRYKIGIDLGTSNSVLAFVDTLERRPCCRVLPIAQEERPGQVVEDPVVPSVAFITAETDAPGPQYLIGRRARHEASFVPGRAVFSAKSWLVNELVDRHAPILPWGSDEIAGGEKLSPVFALSLFLRRLRDGWNETMAEGRYPFDAQDITLTVPASFDEYAQRLTLEAAALAGFPESVRLLEEPQAAFYAWLENEDATGELSRIVRQSGRSQVTVLVCDIGGGTTDFSLFDIAPGTDNIDIRRRAIGDHILLGGDNIDLALAHFFAEQFVSARGYPVTAKQWRYLCVHARALKEEILSDSEAGADAAFHLALPGEGASLFAGAHSVSITRREFDTIVFDGFFPVCGRHEGPWSERVGLLEAGLPYAADSAITRHLAEFLSAHLSEEEQVDVLLCAGGSLRPYAFQRVLQTRISSWQNGVKPVLLATEGAATAIARGAALYGMLLSDVRRRIRADYARSIYVEVEGRASLSRQVVCILPFGAHIEEVSRVEYPRFHLLVSQPVRFQLYYSTKRAHDKVGETVTLSPTLFHALPPVQTEIHSDQPPGMKKEVLLEVKINELGRVQLFVVGADGNGRWELVFSLKDTATHEEAGVSEASMTQAFALIRSHYGKRSPAVSGAVKHLLKELERELGLSREQWGLSLLRRLWEPLSEGITRRDRSAAHEAAWLSAAGYLLRPGFGSAGDEQRIAELWRCFSLGLSFPKEQLVRTQWWIMWRRVAPGLSREQQIALFDKQFSFARDKKEESPELFRLLCSLDLVHREQKLQVAALLTKKIHGRAAVIDHYLAALGRLCARLPFHRDGGAVLPLADVDELFGTIDTAALLETHRNALIRAAILAYRLTGDELRDAPSDGRRSLSRLFAERGVPQEMTRALREVLPKDRGDYASLLGDTVPLGLSLTQ